MDTTEERREQTGWIGRAWHQVWPVAALTMLCAVFYWDVPWLPADRAHLG